MYGDITIGQMLVDLGWPHMAISRRFHEASLRIRMICKDELLCRAY